MTTFEQEWEGHEDSLFIGLPVAIWRFIATGTSVGELLQSLCGALLFYVFLWCLCAWAAL